MRTTSATDAGIDLDSIADDSQDYGFILLMGCDSWVMTDHALCYLGHAPCPICEGKPLGRKLYCLGCDRTGMDERVIFPGLKVDEARDPEWDDSEWVETYPRRSAG